jgi:predicted nucleotidyltransferase
VNALFEIKKVADSLEISFFVVGATARDFILEHCYNMKSPRMTMDIDLGVEVADWDEFTKLSDNLLATGKFSKDKNKTSEQSSYRLIANMVKVVDNFDEILHQLEKLKEGIFDT